MSRPERMREGFVADEPKPTPAPVAAQVEAPSIPEPDRDKWPVVVNLRHKAVRNSANDMVKVLSFREPTGGDINRYGNPVRIDQNGEVIIDERKMTAIMAVLSGTLTPFLEAMDPRDWNSCAYRLRGFFLPEPEAWV